MPIWMSEGSIVRNIGEWGSGCRLLICMRLDDFIYGIYVSIIILYESIIII